MNPRGPSIVHRFFKNTAKSYDFMVNFGTFGFDRFWKRKIFASIPPDPSHVLDLACGTGIVTFGIAKRHPQSQVIGVDITQEYLDIAKQKKTDRGIDNVHFVHEQAENYFSETSFDCITASYLPKYADLKILVSNLSGLLTTNGILIMHDFTYPSNPLVAGLWEFYFKLQQYLGIWFYPEWRTVYEELPALVRKSDWVKELKERLNQNGFVDIQSRSLTFGSAAIITARKPPPVSN